MTAPRPAPIDRLADVVGAENVLVDDDLRASHELDWTGRFRGTAACVVRPAHGRRARARWSSCWPQPRLPIVTQGGNTGLVGGSVPRGGEVVLSTRAARRDRRGRPAHPPGDGRRRRDAGRRAARPRASTTCGSAVDFGARDSATIGGMAAANAGGTTAVRFGSTRAQVVGLEAVLPSGAVDLAAARAAQGQRRLRPARPAGRQRGHAGRDHPGAAAAAPPAAAAGDGAGRAARASPRRWPPAPSCCACRRSRRSS